jgi:hypothetical protein
MMAAQPFIKQRIEGNRKTENAMSANDPMGSSGRPFLPSGAVQGSELFIRELNIQPDLPILPRSTLHSVTPQKDEAMNKAKHDVCSGSLSDIREPTSGVRFTPKGRRAQA